jgi:hypothetical protein
MQRFPPPSIFEAAKGTLDFKENLRTNSLRARAYQENWQLQRNSNFRELLSTRVENMLLNGAAQIEETTTQFP